MLLRMQNAQLSVALDTWAARAQQLHQMRLAGEKVCRRLRNMSLAAAIGAWQAHVEWKQRAVLVASRCIARMQNERLLVALCAWSTYVSEVIQLGRTLVRVAGRFLYLRCAGFKRV